MKIWLVFFLATITQWCNAQSPWTRSKAGFFVQAAGQIIPPYNTLFSAEGGEQTVPRTLAEMAFQLYGEHGIRHNTTLTVALPVRYLHAGTAQINNPAISQGSLLSMGNVALSLRQQLTKGRLSLCFTVRTDLPAGRFDNLTGIRTGYKAWTFLPMLSTGMGFRKAYWFVWGGYGLRTNNYSHFTQLGAEAGWKLNKYWFIAFSEWVHPLKNGDINLPSNNLLTGLYVNNQGYQSIGIKTLMPFGRFWGVSASAAGALSGQNVPRKPAFSAGIWFKWD